MSSFNRSVLWEARHSLSAFVGVEATSCRIDSEWSGVVSAIVLKCRKKVCK
jgi:hypothetical protein